MSDRRAGSHDHAGWYDAPSSGRRAGSHDPYAGWYDTFNATGWLPRRAADVRGSGSHDRRRRSPPRRSPDRRRRSRSPASVAPRRRSRTPPRRDSRPFVRDLPAPAVLTAAPKAAPAVLSAAVNLLPSNATRDAVPAGDDDPAFWRIGYDVPTLRRQVADLQRSVLQFASNNKDMEKEMHDLRRFSGATMDGHLMVLMGTQDMPHQWVLGRLPDDAALAAASADPVGDAAVARIASLEPARLTTLPGELHSIVRLGLQHSVDDAASLFDEGSIMRSSFSANPTFNRVVLPHNGQSVWCVQYSISAEEIAEQRRIDQASRDEVPVAYTPMLDVGHWVPVRDVVDTKHKASFTPVHSRRIRFALKELQAGKIAETFSL